MYRNLLFPTLLFFLIVIVVGCSSPPSPANPSLEAETETSNPLPTNPLPTVATETDTLSSPLSTTTPILPGEVLQGAAAYDPDAPGPHPVLLLSSVGEPYFETTDQQYPSGISTSTYFWNAYLPSEWAVRSTDKPELIVYIHPEQEFFLGSQTYAYGGFDNSHITEVARYRYETMVELRAASTGQRITTYTYIGSDPIDFPETLPFGTTRLEGYHLTYAVLEDWLEPYVSPQVCWEIPGQPPLLLVFICSATLSPDGQILAAATDGSIGLWDVSSGLLLQTLPVSGVYCSVFQMAFSPDGQVLAAAEPGLVRLWQVSSGTLLHTLTIGTGSTDISPLVFSPDGQVLATALDERIVLWNVSTGTPATTLLEPTPGTHIGQFGFSPDGNTFAALITTGEIQLWQVTENTMTHTLHANGYGHHFAFSSDGQTITTLSEQGDVQVWEVSTGTEVFKPGVGEAWMSGVLASDGDLIATHYGELWSVSAGRLRPLMAYPEAIFPVAFAPDGTTLITKTKNGTAQLWHVADGALLRTIQISDSIESLSFSADGQTLALLGNWGVQVLQASVCNP